MKKIVAVALLVASLCVVGCSNEPAKTPSKPAGAPSTPAAK
jgi:hypothetical protein